MILLQRNRDGVEVAVYSDDGPTPERREKGVYEAVDVLEGDELRRVSVDRLGSPLDALWHTGQLGTDEKGRRRYEAALWLRRLHHKAGLTPSVTGSYEPGSPGQQEMSEAEAWNRKCYAESLRACGRFAHVVARVVCHEQALARNELMLLRSGLDRLADHRGM